jgi:hypothetical protein
VNAFELVLGTSATSKDNKNGIVENVAEKTSVLLSTNYFNGDQLALSAYS